MTDTELTRLLAIIGAVTGGVGALTGIAALTWEVFTWWRSGRVKLSIVPKAGDAYNDQPFPKISVTINNVGQVRTTIQEVSIYCYEGRLLKEWKGVSGGFVSDLFLWTRATPGLENLRTTLMTSRRTFPTTRITLLFPILVPQEWFSSACLSHFEQREPGAIPLPIRMNRFKKAEGQACDIAIFAQRGGILGRSHALATACGRRRITWNRRPDTE